MTTTESAPGFMLDTNVFDALIDGRLRLEQVQPRGGRWVVTHIQRDELERAPEPRRTQLLAALAEVAPEREGTQTAVWDVSRWDDARWTSDPARFQAMLDDLNRRERKGKNNVPDVLIAETALHLGLTLVTGDRHLRETMEALGGRAVDARS